MRTRPEGCDCFYPTADKLLCAFEIGRAQVGDREAEERKRKRLVGERELEGLPAEYGHEPRIALAAGRAGLDSVRIILREAGRHLQPGGLLGVEVGNTETAVRRVFRHLPFVWLDFERGGGGVFVLTAEQLRRRDT